MKKYILTILMIIMACFLITGCGGSSEEEGDKSSDVGTASSPAGNWSCTAFTMNDNGTEMTTEDFEELYEMEVGEMASLTGYADGTGELTLLGETAAITWEEDGDGYILSDGNTDEMKATLADNQLIVVSESSYDADGQEVKTVMTITFAYQGKASSVIKGWDLQLTDEETAAMSTHIVAGESVVVDDMLYGSFGGSSYDEGTFSVGKISSGKSPDVKDRTVIADSRASSLKEHDGYVYGVLNWEKIVKVKVGETKAETIYEGACDYLQIADGKIYFVDKDYRLCSMDLDGKNVETVIDKKDMYYTYVFSNGMVLYQDDPDNESLHVYDLNTGNDYKLNDEVSYNPIICGNYLYYTNQVSDTEYTFNRIDLYTGEKETAPGTMDNSEFFIDNGKITFCVGGLPTFSIDEWDALAGASFAGLVMEVRSSNGEYRVLSDSNGEMYIRSAAFDEDGENTAIGY